MAPKITAGTVREHHEIMFDKLVDAAESILRQKGPNALTAGSVAMRAGIARNSIYRYVNSVDDLRIHVLERYLPRWQERACAHIQEATSQEDQLFGLVRISLELANETGHQWLMNVLRSTKIKGYRSAVGESSGSGDEGSVPSTPMILNFHRDLALRITELWKKIAPEHANINSRLTRSLLDSGMRAVDDGISLEHVETAVIAALSALPRS